MAVTELEYSESKVGGHISLAFTELGDTSRIYELGSVYPTANIVRGHTVRSTAINYTVTIEFSADGTNWVSTTATQAASTYSSSLAPAVRFVRLSLTVLSGPATIWAICAWAR